MAERGLTNRLRQHSRRSGMMVGVSMAIAIAICIVTFIWIYVRLGPLLSDFIPAPVEEPRPAPVGLGGVATPEAAGFEVQPTPTIAPTPTPPSTPTVEPTPRWLATHRIADNPGNQSVNLRAGPNTVSAILGSYRPGTPLQFLGERQLTGTTVWLRVQTEDGAEGWMREMDLVVEP